MGEQEVHRTRWRRLPVELLAVLLVGLVNGMVFIVLMPPWQHYDEPNHFEYAWLIASREKLPQINDFDPAMRINVARSMIAHDFFKELEFLPNLEDASGKVWIGPITQLDDPPLYYILASLAMKPFPRESILHQLYAGRVVSLILFLLTLLAAWGTAVELTPTRHPLRWMLPLTLALMPAFVDVMTAFNNAAGATALFSLFIWGATRLVKSGFSWWVCLGTAAAAGLCLYAQPSVYLAIPLLVPVILFSILRGSHRKWAWLTAAVMLGVGLLAVFTWGDAALWNRQTFQSSATRSRSPEAPLGSYAFRLELKPGEAPAELLQLLPPETGKSLAGKPFTLGAWMWTSRPIELRTPLLNTRTGGRTYGSTVQVGEIPGFYAFQGVAGKNTERSWVRLAPAGDTPDQPLEIYYDGVVLAEGAYPIDQAPQFDGEDGGSGTWGGLRFMNLLRNASAEGGWPRLRNQFERAGSQLLPLSGLERVSLVFYTFADLRGAGWQTSQALTTIGRTFWGNFGWAHIPLLGHKPYRFLALVTLAGTAGAAVWAFRKRRQIPWEVVFIYSLILAGIWGQALVRGSTYILLPLTYQAVARYIYPAIIPTMLVLVCGWKQILDAVVRLLPSARRWVYAVYPALLVLLNLYGIYSILKYYGS